MGIYVWIDWIGCIDLSHCSIARMQLWAGFVGADKFHFAYAGTMVAVNTFGADLLAVVVCAVLGTLFASPADHLSRTCMSQTEWVVILYRTSGLLGAMVAVTVLREHLMLWAVFAPKVGKSYIYSYYFYR